MRFLLDEMFPPAVAVALRDRGHDVVAVKDRPDLESADDTTVFAHARRERRAVVTENVADFAVIAGTHANEVGPHHGVLFVLEAGLPRKRAQVIGAMTRKLDAYLQKHTTAEADSRVDWP